ncbi:hypothetical protein NDI37_10095 [Funiculus sociatus GB2-A5]|uniref:Thylakoid-associated protein n=1 Tax=Funiculus sociatus GB2-A5 TaxID=2933946 RepID=A0ABV0JNY0_9CYAN|nr:MULTISPECIES: hypothetical protein [unclassified Trichocoleus]MBD1907847.1 hypothetical protein [Trichocoleus sp. FACHB-832]MBD2064025.1 hypothetical protein [Trichocoleus sp. FACHB-6]
MDWANNFEQFTRQLSELQSGIFKSWTSTMPTMQGFNTPNYRETFEKTLKFQEEVLTSSLQFQALVARLSIETQKQLWDAYFNTMRNTQLKKSE